MYYTYLLSSQDQSNPGNDFSLNTPPGLLALDNICYFSNKYQESCVKVSHPIIMEANSGPHRDKFWAQLAVLLDIIEIMTYDEI